MPPGRNQQGTGQGDPLAAMGGPEAAGGGAYISGSVMLPLTTTLPPPGALIEQAEL